MAAADGVTDQGLPLILAPYLRGMTKPKYRREFSPAERLQLVAFETILRDLPIWMVVAIWEAARNDDPLMPYNQRQGTWPDPTARRRTPLCQYE